MPVLEVSEDSGQSWQRFEPVHKFSRHSTPAGFKNRDRTTIRPACQWLEVVIDHAQAIFFGDAMARIRLDDGSFFPDVPLCGQITFRPYSVRGKFDERTEVIIVETQSEEQEA